MWTASVEWANRFDKMIQKRCITNTEQEENKKNRSYITKWMNATSAKRKLKYHLNYASCKSSTKIIWTKGENIMKCLKRENEKPTNICWSFYEYFVENIGNKWCFTTKSTYRYTFTFNTIHNTEWRSQIGIPCWA